MVGHLRRELYWKQRIPTVVLTQAWWRGRCFRRKLGPWGVKTQALTNLATKLQSRWRGSSVRKKLLWAQNVARLVEDALPVIELPDMPEFLNPFDICVPHFDVPEAFVEEYRSVCAEEEERVEAERIETEDCSRASSAAPSCRPESPRRFKVDRIADEWGVNAQTAKSLLIAVKKRKPKKPEKPALNINATAPNEKCLRAQDAIRDFQKQFYSGQPNRKLSRSAKEQRE